MTRIVRIVLSATVLLLLSVSTALAQATIAGVVRDSSGAILPGASVEATSSSLTEKVRTAVSDAAGQYRIVTLPPGAYTVTFTLAGFKSVRRDNVSVSGSGVIPINADMQLGSLEETITVTGASPLVDTQTTRRETVVSAETINALPITRNYGGVLYATPGLTVQAGVNNNAIQRPCAGRLAGHRARHPASPHASALLIGFRVAWRAHKGARASQKRRVDRIDRGGKGTQRRAASER